MWHKDICIGQMRIMSPLALLYSSLRIFSIWRTVDYKARGGVWGRAPAKFVFLFFRHFKLLYQTFFTKNWRGCGTLLLGEGSNAVKPFLDILSIFRQFPYDVKLRQYITKGYRYNFWDGVCPSKSFDLTYRNS